MRCDHVAVGTALLCLLAAGCGSSPAAGPGTETATGSSGSEAPDAGTGDTGSGGSCGDVLGDPNNCGSCGVVCQPLHAAAVCVQGRCAHGPCAAGYFDLDGDPADGCEASCDGAVCTASYGTIVLSSPPVPDTGVVASALSSSGSVDPGAALGPTLGILGESTPLPYRDPSAVGADGETSSSLVVNLVGYGAALR
jgi:hypothetical protein